MTQENKKTQAPPSKYGDLLGTSPCQLLEFRGMTQETVVWSDKEIKDKKHEMPKRTYFFEMKTGESMIVEDFPPRGESQFKDYGINKDRDKGKMYLIAFSSYEVNRGKRSGRMSGAVPYT